MEIIIWVAIAVFSTSSSMQIINSDEAYKSKEDCEIANAKAKDEIIKIKAIKAYGLSCTSIVVKTKYDA